MHWVACYYAKKVPKNRRNSVLYLMVHLSWFNLELVQIGIVGWNLIFYSPWMTKNDCSEFEGSFGVKLEILMFKGKIVILPPKIIIWSWSEIFDQD